MTDTLEHLKIYDIETIYNKTQITPQSIKALLAHDFSPFTRARFFGFVSIVEREFRIDLSSYKKEYISIYGMSKKSIYVFDQKSGKESA